MGLQCGHDILNFGLYRSARGELDQDGQPLWRLQRGKIQREGLHCGTCCDDGAIWPIGYLLKAITLPYQQLAGCDYLEGGPTLRVEYVGKVVRAIQKKISNGVYVKYCAEVQPFDHFFQLTMNVSINAN